MPRFLLTVLMILSVFFLNAQNDGFHIIKDINTLSNSSPGSYRGFASDLVGTMAELNNVCYFFANDGVHGSEIWRSDGTGPGTYRISDVISDNVTASAGMNLTAGREFLYFTAYKPNGEYCIFKLNPVDNAVESLFEIQTTFLNPIESLYFFNDALYFVVTDGSYANQLWKSDGTRQGTILVKDINSEGAGSSIYGLCQAGNLLYFAAYKSAYGNELWRSDGTEAGTFMIKDTDPSTTGGAIFYITPLNNKIYYLQSNGTTTYRLWVTDGTSEGTTEIKNPKNASVETYFPYYLARRFTVAGNTLFFSASTPETGTDLWKLNTTQAKGIEPVTNIEPGNTVTYPMGNLIGSINETVFFVYRDAGNSYHLYKSKGTVPSTQLVTDLPITYVSYLYSKNNKLYFSASNAANGYELWVSDGTANGTLMTGDINPGTASSNPYGFCYCNNKMLFAATDNARGTELWRITNTNKVQIVKDINTSTTKTSSVKDLVPFGSGAIFTAISDNWDAKELWQTDGTNVVNIKDRLLKQSIYRASYIQVYDENAFILSDNKTIYSLNVHDTVADIRASDVNRYISYYTVRDSGTIIYYSMGGSPYSSLMKKQPNDTAVVLKTGLRVTSQNNVSGKLSPAFLTIGRNTYFEGNEEGLTGRNGLWQTDGTPGGTTIVKAINPYSSSDIYLLTNYNNLLHFRAKDNSGNALWRSDGTTEGTVKVSTINPSEMIVYKNRLFISGSFSNTGYELYSFDGSKTELIKDIYYGTTSSNPANFFIFNSILYFTANDGTYGTELWRTDGTAPGTYRVKDLTPGSGSSKITGLTEAAGKFFFTKDGALWLSDGTLENTNPISDPALEGVTAANTISNGDMLYFAGTNFQYGTEPWVGNVYKFGRCGDSAAFKPKITCNSLLCPGSYVIMYTKYGYADYVWSNGDKGDIIDVDTPGIYTVRIKYADACYSTSDPFVLNYGCATPIVYEPSDLGLTKVTVHWNGKTCAVKYKLQLTQNGVLLKAFTLDSSYHSYTFNGLSANTTYQWRIASVCQAGSTMQSPWSSFQAFTTSSNVVSSNTMPSSAYLNVKEGVSLYPNPCIDFITVNIPYLSSTIIIADIEGKQLRSIRGNKGSNRIPVSGLGKGTYLLILKTDRKSHTLKFLKIE